ncbi:MAG TPA: hypothetical protein VFW24_18570 [Acidimicrobiales bacterium]|nr:hypothetical protein [Acidimicrobiales bacterium]
MVRISARLSPEDTAVVLVAVETARRALATDAHRARTTPGVSPMSPPRPTTFPRKRPRPPRTPPE